MFLLLSEHLAIAQIDYKGFPEWSLQKKDSTEYALYTPAHLQRGERYPIVLFMHGCCGVDNHASLRNAVDPPIRMWHQFGRNRQTVPTYIIAPATARGWKQHFAALKAVMDDLVAHHQGDPQRIYVCGFSMGGEGTFRIIQEYPGYFAAAIPMGMSFSGDSLKVKDIPLWINQGETDYYSRHLARQVAAIRALNGYTTDTGNTAITGVNPRYANFKGTGHGVQWIAASTQDLTGWAYSKINDGHLYPTLFFEQGDGTIMAERDKPVALTVHAASADSISRVEIYVNHVLKNTLKAAPYRFVFTPAPGDNEVKAVAQTIHHKSAEATTVVSVPIRPHLTGGLLPAAHAGRSYQTMLQGIGNCKLLFAIKNGTRLPPGIVLYPEGMLKGICTVRGSYTIHMVAKDKKGNTADGKYKLSVLPKQLGVVLVTNAGTDSIPYRVGAVKMGEALFFNSKDSLLSLQPQEINFSETGMYDGLTFIQTDENDAHKTADDLLHFTIDEDATIYIAYEKIERPSTSRVPAWLQSFKKENTSIVAQYRYFEVYSKRYQKGDIRLPGAAAKQHGVTSNYFVMIQKVKAKD